MGNGTSIDELTTAVVDVRVLSETIPDIVYGRESSSRSSRSSNDYERWWKAERVFISFKIGSRNFSINFAKKKKQKRSSSKFKGRKSI